MKPHYPPPRPERAPHKDQVPPRTFSGKLRDSLPLTDRERAAVNAANQATAIRSPTSEKRLAQGISIVPD